MTYDYIQWRMTSRHKYMYISYEITWTSHECQWAFLFCFTGSANKCWWLLTMYVYCGIMQWQNVQTQLSEKSSNRHGSIVSNGVLYHVRHLILLLFLTTALHESDTTNTFSWSVPVCNKKYWVIGLDSSDRTSVLRFSSFRHRWRYFSYPV